MTRTLSIGLGCCLLASAALGQKQSTVVAASRTESEMRQPAGQPLVMVHGIASSPDTWTTLQGLMANDGWGIHTPELSPFASFVENKVALNNYFYFRGLGSNTVLLGHSMGGSSAGQAAGRTRSWGS